MKKLFAIALFAFTFYLWSFYFSPPKKYTIYDIENAELCSIKRLKTKIDDLLSQLVCLEGKVERAYSTELTGGLYQISQVNSTEKIWIATKGLTPLQNSRVKIWAFPRAVYRSKDKTFIILTQVGNKRLD